MGGLKQRTLSDEDNMRSKFTFDPNKLKANKYDFDYEIGTYNHLKPSKWLKSQRSAFFTQFSGESRKAPQDQVLKSIGYLIWSCSLYETKISRANFWLNCYIQNEIIELPGQAVKRSKLITTFFKLLEHQKTKMLFGAEGIKFYTTVIESAEKSISIRDDVIHGHYQGMWSKDVVFRAKGNKFEVEKSYEVSLSSRKLMRHANKILTAAAALSLIDALFDNTYNGY